MSHQPQKLNGAKARAIMADPRPYKLIAYDHDISIPMVSQIKTGAKYGWATKGGLRTRERAITVTERNRIVNDLRSIMDEHDIAPHTVSRLIQVAAGI